jgi:prepilin-type N-terminal cleavage/methylation domain-containing protein
MRRRVGFTLIELLVVIAIIGVLISLLMAGVMKVLGKTDEVRARNDITQLSQAGDSFKTKLHVDYIPSRIILGPKRVYFVGTTLRPGIYTDSFNYLNRVWPRMNWDDPSSPIVWSWRNDYNPLPDGVLLEGQECLVFFLGGIPNEVPPASGNRGCFGFSKNPNNPTAPGGERDTFYDFLSNRLKTRNEYARPATGSVGFYAYLDSYGKQPYAYFSSYKTANQYNRYSGTDCPHLNNGIDNTGVYPYAELWDPNRKYLNSNTFQIISAGPDGFFGRGTRDGEPLTLWRQGQQNFSPTQPGYDDMSNFSDRPLGIPTN